MFCSPSSVLLMDASKASENLIVPEVFKKT